MKSKRIEEIEAYIYEHKTVTLDQLCEKFKVSKNTIRRDLDDISADGSIKKIYGGAAVRSKNELAAFQERHIENLESKKKIAAKAAGLIEDNDIIFIDSGTTTFHIIDHISDKNLTIITNNMEVIIRALPLDNVQLITLSGTLSRKTLSFTGDSAADNLCKFNINKSFMSASGLSSQGAADSSELELRLKKAAVQRSQSVYMMTDSSKFNIVSLMTYCSLPDIDAIITDKIPAPPLSTAVLENSVEIILAGS